VHWASEGHLHWAGEGHVHWASEGHLHWGDVGHGHWASEGHLHWGGVGHGHWASQGPCAEVQLVQRGPGALDQQGPRAFITFMYFMACHLAYIAALY
jgi:hypothetical protein